MVYNFDILLRAPARPDRRRSNKLSLMRKLLLTSLTLALLAPLSAVGGHGKKQCAQNLEDCLNQMVNKLKTTGFIGLEVDYLAEGTVVTKVVAGTPAEEAGIQKGDVLVALNGIPFNKESKKKIGKLKKVGREVTCTIKRNGTNKSVKLTLAPMPADVMAKYIGERMMAHANREAHASASR